MIRKLVMAIRRTMRCAEGTPGVGEAAVEASVHEPPRVYLDTADLLNIGDGRVAADDLVRTMARTDAVLVVSREHVQDASRGNRSAIDSLIRAVESFPRIAVVMDGPHSVEPLTTDRRDIVIAACTNFRELARSDTSRAWLATMNALVDLAHEGDRDAQSTLAQDALPEFSRAAWELFLQSLVTMFRGWLGDDPETILSHWEGKVTARLPQRLRAGVLQRLEAARHLFTGTAAVENDVDVANALLVATTWEAEPAAWPGHVLGLRVSKARRRDVRRRPRRSDLPDVDHLMHIPYVNVATCDGETLPRVQRELPRLTCPRAPVVLNVGHLDRVAEALGRVAE
jgi:hypothetical protein